MLTFELLFFLLFVTIILVLYHSFISLACIINAMCFENSYSED